MSAAFSASSVDEAHALRLRSGTSSCFMRSSICRTGATRSSGRSSPVSAASPIDHISSRATIQRSAPARIRKPGGTPIHRPSSRSQPSAMEWNVPTAGAGAWIRSSIRSRISLAARSVKVMTRIDAGETPDATSRPNRSAMTAVLPVPAPATTRTGPAPSAAARDCSRPSFMTVWTGRCARGALAPCVRGRVG